MDFSTFAIGCLDFSYVPVNYSVGTAAPFTIARNPVGKESAERADLQRSCDHIFHTLHNKKTLNYHSYSFTLATFELGWLLYIWGITIHCSEDTNWSTSNQESSGPKYQLLPFDIHTSKAAWLNLSLSFSVLVDKKSSSVSSSPSISFTTFLVDHVLSRSGRVPCQCLQ